MSTMFAPPTGPAAWSPPEPVPPGSPSDPTPSTPRRAGFLVVAVLALLALGVGAFVALDNAGGDDVALPTVDAYSLAAAAEATLAARTVEFDLTVDAAGLGAVTVSGAVDNEAGLMTVSSDLSGLLPIDDALPMDGGSVELLLDSNTSTMYIGASGFGELFGVESPWISADLGVLAEQAGVSLDELRAETFIDPTETARLLLDADEVTEIGAETIDGVVTKHFQVTVDLAGALAAIPTDELPELGELPDLDVPETVVYDVWVTADNELRRASFDLDVAGQSVSTVLDMTTSDQALVLAVPADAFDITAWLDW
jgi:hypothetical protein